MNFASNAAFDLAEQRIEEEREAAIAASRAALMANGTIECVDCGCTISIARKRVYPSARRCLECQEFTEKEARCR